MDRLYVLSHTAWLQVDTKRAVQLTIPRIFRSLYTLTVQAAKWELAKWKDGNLRPKTRRYSFPTCIRFAVAFTAALAVGRSMDVSTALAAARLCHRARFSCHVKIKCNWHQDLNRILEIWHVTFQIIDLEEFLISSSKVDTLIPLLMTKYKSHGQWSDLGEKFASVPVLMWSLGVSVTTEMPRGDDHQALR